MNNNDYFLISRNNTVYRCPIYALSTVLCFVSEKEKFISEIYELSSTIVDIESFFPLTHYTRSEIKSEFTTKKELDILKENAMYIKKTEANAEVAKLSSKSQVKIEFENTGKHCLNNILSKERDKIDRIMTFQINEGDNIADYVKNSADDDVIDKFVTDGNDNI